MKRILALIAVTASLGACDGGRGERAVESPAPVVTDVFDDPVCTLIAVNLVTSMANAESQTGDPSEIVDVLGETQLALQRRGRELIDEGQEALGQTLVDLSATAAKVRLGIMDGDPLAVRSAARQARVFVSSGPIRDRCGDISTGAA